MRTNTYKIIVAHPAQQHSFRTATGIKKAGYLYKYITTVYDRQYSFTRLCIKILKGNLKKKLSAHRCNDLLDEEVMQFCELENMILLFLRRLDKKRKLVDKFNKYLITKFNKKVAKYAIKNNIDAVIMYDTLAFTAFQILKKTKPLIKCLLDMSAPNFVFMDLLFKHDIINNMPISELLIQEMEKIEYKDRLIESFNEIRLADYFLVASSFTSQSLLDYGIEKSKIYKCIYGVDSTIFNRPDFSVPYCEKLNCVFIGNVTQKKGFHYLIKAIKNIDNDRFSFTIVGDYESSNPVVKNVPDICEFVGHVTKDRIIKILQSADVLIFPSLCDGFGLSVIEALACGVPVVCSKNAGVKDLIIEGYNGFVINPENSNEIEEKLNWFDANRDIFPLMRHNCRNSVLKYTWERYESSLIETIDSIFMS